MITESNMTIYAKANTNDTEVWTRTVFYKVHWEDAKGANVAKSGTLEADRVTVFVPFASGALVVKIGDVLVRGIVSDNPASPGFSIKGLKATYASVATIRSIDKNDYGSRSLRHWQLGAT
jgi:hypothetical protein